MLDGHHKCILETVVPMLRAGRFESAILDSGAFTVLSKGITVSIGDYIDFALKYGHLFDQIVTLDDIAGDLATTRALVYAYGGHSTDEIDWRGRTAMDVAAAR